MRKLQGIAGVLVALLLAVAPALGQKQMKSVTLTLSIGAAPLAIVSLNPFPTLTAGVAFSQVLSASGGKAPYTFNVASGSCNFTIPDGKTLTWTPTSPTSCTTTLRVVDSSSPQLSFSASFSVTVVSSTLNITTTALPQGTEGVAYSASIATSGGTPPVSCALVGTLPSGLTFNGATCAISGTPAVGTGGSSVSLTFTVADSGQ